jgi:hypothetical protein
MTVIALKSNIEAPNHCDSQIHGSNYMNRALSLIKGEFIIDQEIKCEEGTNATHFSFTRYTANPTKQLIYLYNIDNRLVIRISKFHPIKFANVFNIYLADIINEISAVSEQFYNNQIDRQTYNAIKSDMAKNLKEIIEKRYGKDVFLDLDDHVQGDPVHLTMDLSVITPGKLQILNSILSTTHLTRRG